MRRRQALLAPEPLDAILSRAGENRFARVHSPIAARLWRDAVGARIAEHAQPVSLNAGTLVLRVPSSVWAHELSLLADVLCERLQQCGVEASTLRFRVGPLPPLERPPERCAVRAVPVRRAVPPEMSPVLERIGDDRLRGAIARAATANLAWQAVTQRGPPFTTDPNVTQRAARAPRCVEEETCPPDPTSPASRAGATRKRASEPSRSR